MSCIRFWGRLVCGLAASDGSSYRRYAVAEYLAGYSGVPPLVHLRRGETLRRYLDPGLEDGKTFSMLKRHLMTDHKLTPQQYRERWGLQRDYPMVAPNYARTRSALAKKIGLGRKSAKPAKRVAVRRKRGAV